MNSTIWNTSSTTCNTTGINCDTIIANSAAQEEALESYRRRFDAAQAMLVTSATMGEEYVRVAAVAAALEVPLPKVVHRAIEVVVAVSLPPGYDEDDLTDSMFHSPRIVLSEVAFEKGVRIEECDIESVRPFDIYSIE